MTERVITLGPFKVPEFHHLGFAWGDIIRPVGCGSCGWYGTDFKMHPTNGRMQCIGCGSNDMKCFPGIAPDMLQ